MKTIGLLGGTGWSSTIEYYRLLNEMVYKRLGGYHSAKILLKSIDYHDIMVNYGKNHELVSSLLKSEVESVSRLNPDCLIICCNSLHKYYDMIKKDLNLKIPVFHAVNLTAQYINEKNYKKVLLLATKFTMEDGFFANILEESGISVEVPKEEDRTRIAQIHSQLMNNEIRSDSKDSFKEIILSYGNVDAVVLGCSEFGLVVHQESTSLPLIDPLDLQVRAAVEYSLSELSSG